MKPFWIILSAVFSVLMMSCSDNSVVADKVELSSIISRTEFLDKYSLQQITASEELKVADFALITYIGTDNVMNNHITPPAISSGAFAIPTDNINTDLVLLANDTLSATSPLLYPGYFFTPKSWSLAKHNYGNNNLWQISYKGMYYDIPTKLQSSVYRVLLNTYDTIDLKQTLIIKWSPASIPNSNDKVYISFKWYPSFSDSKYFKDFPGFEVTDSGIFTPTIQDMQALSIPDYGILQVNVMRYNKELVQVLGKKFFVVNIAQSHSSMYIRK